MRGEKKFQVVRNCIIMIPIKKFFKKELHYYNDVGKLIEGRYWRGEREIPGPKDLYHKMILIKRNKLKKKFLKI